MNCLGFGLECSSLKMRAFTFVGALFTLVTIFGAFRQKKKTKNNITSY